MAYVGKRYAIVFATTAPVAYGGTFRLNRVMHPICLKESCHLHIPNHLAEIVWMDDGTELKRVRDENLGKERIRHRKNPPHSPQFHVGAEWGNRSSPGHCGRRASSSQATLRGYIEKNALASGRPEGGSFKLVLSFTEHDRDFC